MAVALNPYLNFPGTTREAMTFYQSVLGGELQISTFSPREIGGIGPRLHFNTDDEYLPCTSFTLPREDVDARSVHVVDAIGVSIRQLRMALLARDDEEQTALAV